MTALAAEPLTGTTTWDGFAEATLTRQPEAGHMGRELAEGSDADWAYARMNWRFGLKPSGPFEVRAYAVFAREVGQ